MGILGLRTSADHPMVLGVRMRAMLLSSLTVVAFSIFPIILARYGASSDALCTASSRVLFVVAAAGSGRGPGDRHADVFGPRLDVRRE